MKTATFAAGAAVGYILGTKAGREKYQQIVNGVHALGRQPAVQQAQSKIKNLVGQTATPTGEVGSAGVTTVPATSKKASASTADPLAAGNF